ncbi:MAG: hypothetical protein RR949_02625 [Oscillospiraceae bacterium]
MGFLQDTLEKFRNDEHWNTPEHDGGHRFDREIAWIEKMVGEYAETLKMEPNRVAEIMEKNRTYSWPNYYQEANFPGINAGSVIGVFDTFEAFRNYTTEHWDGFKCPHCGDISKHPTLCVHRLNKDGKCDWCSGGFFASARGVIVIENGLELIRIFEPVEKEEVGK